MSQWRVGFVSRLIHVTQIPAFRRFISRVVCAAVLLWCGGYYATEAWSPLGQVGGMWARCCGPKYQRTVREADTNMAMFHLSYAVLHTYTYDALNEGQELPLSWRELIRDTGGYAGSHMVGTLTQMYPFLMESDDPWGRPWVFRIVQIGRRPDGAHIEFTYGSLGPDGRQCEQIKRDYETARRMCDDLIKVKRLWRVPLSSVPERIPEETRVQEDFFVPGSPL